MYSGVPSEDGGWKCVQVGTLKSGEIKRLVRHGSRTGEFELVEYYANRSGREVLLLPLPLPPLSKFIQNFPCTLLLITRSVFLGRKGNKKEGYLSFFNSDSIVEGSREPKQGPGD